MEPIQFEQLSKDKLERLYKEANVDVTNKEVIEDVRRWCMHQPPYIPESLFDDKVIAKYILYCKNVDVAKEKLVELYRTKIEYHYALLCDPLEERFQKSYPVLHNVALPKLTPEGYRIIYCQPSDDPTIVDFSDVLNCLNAQLSYLMHDDSMELGWMLMFNCESITMRHLVNSTPHNFKMTSTYIKKQSNRVKAIIYVNVNPLVEKLIKMVSGIVKEKVENRIFVYTGGVEEFLNHVPKVILPIELGGTDSTLADIKERWYTRLKENRQMFLNEKDILKKYVNMQNLSSRRRSRSSRGSLGEVAAEGIRGSFKSLNID